MPDLQRLPPGETVRPFTVTPTHLGFDEYDVASQIAHSHHYWVIDGVLETFSAPFRYVWPSELDLMARLAGMTLRERWNGWDRAPFTSASRQHVSVWEKPRESRHRVVSRRSPATFPSVAAHPPRACSSHTRRRGRSTAAAAPARR